MEQTEINAVTNSANYAETLKSASDDPNSSSQCAPSHRRPHSDGVTHPPSETVVSVFALL
ncbi:hypothetical protein KIN20_024241 [Parelaphostrongylus tenuis]|uniref:Uncharacterized protein n=1 Tax=Parelaphostrongylus tenuis TaxID=148309 RepID=A0AAD5QVU6_PARTN|nr:hypothetical protein KIN20_024241 [Parelaphostrongylus tenuis]